MATVAVDGLQPVIDPARPAAHSKLNRLLGTFDTGEHVLLVDGPRHEDGIDYWQVTDGRGGAVNFGELGWVAARGRDSPTLVPFEPSCLPTDGLMAGKIVDLGGLESLVCFRGLELTLHGQVECNRAIADGGIAGANYMDSNRHCALDGVMPIYGDVITSLLDDQPLPVFVAGRLAVTGHVDDNGAKSCRWIPIGVSLDMPGPGEPGPVVACRQHFVVTSIEPIQ